MATLKQGIANYLLSIPEISTAVGGRIYSRRVVKGKTQAPYIVYSVDGYTNKLGRFQGVHGYKGQKVLIDVVGEYEKEDEIDALGDKLVALLSGMQGDFGGRTGSFGFLNQESGYDEKSDFIVYRLELLCKSVF